MEPKNPLCVCPVARILELMIFCDQLHEKGYSMLEPSRTLLIVTDIQGKLAASAHDKETLIRNIGITIEGCKILDIPILWLEQYPQGIGPTIPEVASHLEGYTPLPKFHFSSLREPVVDDRFRELGRTQAVLVGIETHVCIMQTALDLIDREVETHVVADAVSSRTLQNKKIALNRIAQAGGIITSTEAALFELMGEARGDTFKRILPLVK